MVPRHTCGAVRRHRLDGDTVLELRNDRLERRHTGADILVDSGADITGRQSAHVIRPDRREALHVRDELIETLVTVRQRRLAVRECRQHDIAELDAVGRDSSGQSMIELDKELREVVHEYQENPKGPAEHATRARGHLALEEWREEAKEPHQTSVEFGPAFVPRSRQELRHKEPVRDDREPAKSESWGICWLRNSEDVSEAL